MELEYKNIWWSSNELPELSNLAYRPFIFCMFNEEFLEYESVEHAYQTLKAKTTDWATYKNSKWKNGGVKIIGKLKAVTEKDYNIKLMEILIRASFKQNPSAEEFLKNTGISILTHTQDKGIWKTKFPEILMRIREEL